MESSRNPVRRPEPDSLPLRRVHSFRLHPPALWVAVMRVTAMLDQAGKSPPRGIQDLWRRVRARPPSRGGRPFRRQAIPAAARHGHPPRWNVAAAGSMAPARFAHRPAAPAVSVRPEAARRWKGRRRFRNGPWCAILDPARAPYLHRDWLCCLPCPIRGACLFFRVPVRRWRALPPSWPILSNMRRRAGCRPSATRGHHAGCAPRLRRDDILPAGHSRVRT